MSRPATSRAYLSLGSNLDPDTNLRSALDALREHFGEVVVSPVYRTQAVGFEGRDFLNAAAIVQCTTDPYALNAWLHALEDAHGRDVEVPGTGRTLAQLWAAHPDRDVPLEVVSL